MQNPALPPTEPDPAVAKGSRRDVELVASLPAFAFLPALLIVVALSAVFLWEAGARGRDVEFVGAALAVLSAYLFPWPLVSLLLLAALADVVVLEHRDRRFDFRHVWQLAFYAAAICFGSLLSAHLRRAASRQRADVRHVLERAETVAEDRSFETLLTGPHRLGSLDYELDRSRRHTREFALLVVRPDTAVLAISARDRHRVMSALARTVGDELRAIDVAFRRDEWSYCVILAETGVAGARVAAERIRLSLVTESGDEKLTVSIGVAVFPHDATANDDLVDAATRALKHGVELGGNRTVLARAPEEAPAGWGLTESSPAGP